MNSNNLNTIFSSSLYYELMSKLKEKNNSVLISEEKRKKIKEIKKEYEKKVAKLRIERDVVIREAVLLLEKKKIEEIKGKI